VQIVSLSQGRLEDTSLQFLDSGGFEEEVSNMIAAMLTTTGKSARSYMMAMSNSKRCTRHMLYRMFLSTPPAISISVESLFSAMSSRIKRRSMPDELLGERYCSGQCLGDRKRIMWPVKV
jgi:hypothetical protein